MNYMGEPGQTPNILLITTDAQRAEAYGFETPAVQTPHIDLLARE